MAQNFSPAHTLFETLWENRSSDAIVMTAIGEMDIDPVLHMPIVKPSQTEVGRLALWGLASAEGHVYGILARAKPTVGFTACRLALMSHTAGPSLLADIKDIGLSKKTGSY